jgi:phosphatidate phosphatase APP1
MALFQRDPWIIDVFRTYSGEHHLYVRGRALEDQPLKHYEQQTFYQTIRNTWSAFSTDELRHIAVRLTLPNGEFFNSATDSEGYFLFDVRTKADLQGLADDAGYLQIHVAFDEGNSASHSSRPGRIAKAKTQQRIALNKFTGESLVPPCTSGYGVISDIDDTIMKTGVTSFLKLRVAFNTFFRNYDQRSPFKDAANFYQLLHRGTSGKDQNPMFYLSNSPWNLYRYLEKFVDFHGFPKGPILLRDFPTPWDRTKKRERPHKEHELINILKHYPDQKFILIGDAGEHDTTYYTNAAKEYPERIKAIYIRAVNHSKKMATIKEMAEAFEVCPVLLVKESSEAMAHAQEMGWIV